jgi:uncharacterized membrane protein (UPF0127 family)
LTIRRAERFLDRLKGLMFEKSIAPDTGLWISPCCSVHTFFMKFPIDVIFLDREKRVLKLCERIPPNRIGAICLAADSVLECRAGFIAEHGLTVNHVLDMEPLPDPAATLLDARFRLC